MGATGSSAKLEAGGLSASQPQVKTAKLFKNGRSQAVRLPKEFRFEGTEVAVRRDPETGEVVLSQPPAQPSKTLREWFDLFHSLEIPEDIFKREVRMPGKLTARELFDIFDWAGFPDDFMAEREVHMPRDLDLF
jgi:antitoxin VapB